MMRLLLVALLLLTALPAAAVEPDEMLADPVLEARARDISKGLRCLVCQNQSIDESNAPLARDLRILVRERLSAGDTDDQAIAFIVARYGDFVLLQPPFMPTTLILWLAPPLVLVGAAAGGLVYLRRRRAIPPPVPLSAEERERLAMLMAPADERAREDAGP